MAQPWPAAWTSATSDVRDCFYTALLMHVGCVAVAHESAAAFGDDIALNRARVPHQPRPIRGDVARDVAARADPGMPPAVAARASAFASDGGAGVGAADRRRACARSARDTARRLGLPDSTQQALYHVYESWVGGWAPDGLRGDDIAIASRVARAALDAAVFGQLGGAEAAVDRPSRSGPA